ncbi:hypothetical protein FAZ78_06365 [Cereibacter changlensis]|uniref:O-antigen/teichoic acid export membrane protein n=1 Tax=Cereibacter changlensis TaxID=402884 RepID=A0A4U0Z2L0_9RHOB|nr:oligosaccharide flippase family protein [Cereibacter changlensis]TKA97376.1 hypothetical protein FAZ78_06365 [Cereibacter changlensis]
MSPTAPMLTRPTQEVATPFWKRLLPIYFSLACGALLPFVLAPVIIRSEGLQVYGHYATLILSTQIGLVISEYSFDYTGPRMVLAHSSRSQAENQALNAYCRVLALKLLLLPVALMVSVLAYYALTRGAPQTSEIAAMLLMISGTALVGGWYLIASGQTLIYGMGTGLTRIATVTLSLILLHFEPLQTTDGLELFFAFSTPTFAFGLVIAGRARAKHRRNIEGTGNVGPIASAVNLGGMFKTLKDGLPAFAGNALATAQNWIGPMLVGLVSGPEAVGIYNALERPMRFVTSGLRPLFQVLYPHMVSMHVSSSIAARGLLIKLVMGSLILGTIFVSATLVYSEQLVVALFGSSLVDYHFVLPIFAAWLSLGLMNNFVGIQGLLASERDRKYSTGILIGFITTATLALVLSGQSPYIFWVAIAVLLGEALAAIYYLRAVTSVMHK